MLKIIVCIKQVPHTDKASIDPKKGTLIRDSVERMINPDDLNAIEMALTLRERFGGEITCITMGPPHAEDILREAFAYGVDRGVLISDPCFAGSDSLITSMVLSRAIVKLGTFNIIITGVEAIDGNTGSVGYQISEFFKLPLITKIHKIDILDGSAVIERLYGHEYQQIRVDLPVLLSVNKETNRVRIPALAAINAYFDNPIVTLTMADIGGSEKEFGIKGSPTIVINYESFLQKRGQERISGSTQEKVETFVKKLKKHNILRY